MTNVDDVVWASGRERTLAVSILTLDEPEILESEQLVIEVSASSLAQLRRLEAALGVRCSSATAILLTCSDLFANHFGFESPDELIDRAQATPSGPLPLGDGELAIDRTDGSLKWRTAEGDYGPLPPDVPDERTKITETVVERFHETLGELFDDLVNVLVNIGGDGSDEQVSRRQLSSIRKCASMPLGWRSGPPPASGPVRRVVHTKFGAGSATLVPFESEIWRVRFDDGTERTMGAKFLRDE